MKSVSFFKDYRKENPKIFPFVFKNILHQMAGQEMKDNSVSEVVKEKKNQKRHNKFIKKLKMFL